MNTKFIIPLASLLFIGVSCKKESTSVSSNQDSAKLKAAQDSIKNIGIHPELYGIYSGSFYGDYKYLDKETNEYYTYSDDKKISLKINRITKDSVYGHSIVNGNQRPFQGIFNNDTKSFVLDEPGNDKTDGRFQVNLVGDSLTGKWAAYNDKDVKAPSKKVKLIKKVFAYNPNFMLSKDTELIDWDNPKMFTEKYTDADTGKEEKYEEEKYRIGSDVVFKLNASKQKLTEAQLKNLKKLDLEIIKNSVFARHGYSFKKETYRRFFEQTDWYVPVYANVDNDLSAMEKENVTLLNRFIKYAEDNYDYFGR